MGRVSRIRKFAIYLKPLKFVKKKKESEKVFQSQQQLDAIMALAKNDAGIKRSPAFTSKSPRHFLGLLGAPGCSPSDHTAASDKGRQGLSLTGEP